MRRKARIASVVTLLGGGLLAAACIVVSTTNTMSLLPRTGANYTVKTPVRAHMVNGDVVVFQRGAEVTRTNVIGVGTRYDAVRRAASAADWTSIVLDSVIGLESLTQKVNPGRTLLLATPSGAVSVLTLAVLGAVIFGSCPTIYVDSAGTPALQAESFSYSIAPLLAKRDLDLLNVTPGKDGTVRIEVRNEALETHYIDQMELLEVRHAGDETVLPVARAGLAALRGLAPVGGVRDARGRDVSRQVAQVDGSIFSSDPRLLADAVDGGSEEEFLEFTIPRADGPTMLALTMRSTLLSTAVFYDHMLARSGARSLDWIAADLSRITTVAQLARWYTSNFGLRVLVRDGTEWTQVVRLMDFGPVAWRNVAAMIPRGTGDSVTIRLAFAPDEYQVERIAWAQSARVLEPRVLPVRRVTTTSGGHDDAVGFLRDADDRHLVTEPGHRFFAEFDAGTSSSQRTFLLAADGYYVEWLRPSWATSGEPKPFSTATTRRDILRTWYSRKDSLEAQFFRHRVPVL